MNVGRRVEQAVGRLTSVYVNSKIGKRHSPLPQTAYMPFEDQEDAFENYMASMVGK